MDVFVKGGIVDRSSLSGLYAFPEHEQGEFLKIDLGLNAFQTRAIKLKIKNTKGQI